jgi:hypothetical protein
MGRNEGSKTIIPTVKRLIISEALENRQKPRRALAVELATKIERMGEIVPSEETIERLISKARNHDDPRDKPWSTASMADKDCTIPAEALPSILELWVWARENHWSHEFTIRQAQWAARFYTVTKDMRTLLTLSRERAFEEAACDISGTAIDNPHHLDLWIFSHMTGQTLTLERQKKIIGASKVWLLLDDNVKKTNSFQGLTLDEVEEKLLRDMEHKGGIE